MIVHHQEVLQQSGCNKRKCSNCGLVHVEIVDLGGFLWRWSVHTVSFLVQRLIEFRCAFNNNKCFYFKKKFTTINISSTSFFDIRLTNADTNVFNLKISYFSVDTGLVPLSLPTDFSLTPLVFGADPLLGSSSCLL